MKSQYARATALVAAASILALGASACSIKKKSDTSSSSLKGGSIKSDLLKGDSFKVGSKDFDEQLLLGQITLLSLKAAGAKVTDKTNIEGTANARKALTTGAVDMYWDYTGTGWITFLQNVKPINNTEAQYKATAKEDLQKNGIAWIDPAPANNTYALAQKQDTLDKYKVKSLSDYATLAKKNPSNASVCVESEFKARQDGFPGVERLYGFQLPGQYQHLLDTAVVYTTLNKGGTCNFGEIFTTDGRVESLKLKVLTDDKHFFPVYQPCLTLKETTLKKYPKVETLFKPIAAKLTTKELVSLNRKVSVDGDKPVDVAHDWLKSEGFIG